MALCRPEILAPQFGEVQPMIQKPVVQAPRAPPHLSYRPPLKIVRGTYPPEGQKPKLLDSTECARQFALAISVATRSKPT